MTTTENRNAAAPQSGWEAYCAAARALAQQNRPQGKSEANDDRRS